MCGGVLKHACHISDLKAVSVVEWYIERSVDDELFLTD